MVLRFVLALGLAVLTAGPAHAKEPFNIKGVEIGATMKSLKEIFPEIKIDSFENTARCKSGDVVIENGSTFIALKEDEKQKYLFKLIYVDGIQVVLKAEFSYTSASVSQELFLERINEKYDITVINDENILKAKNAMADYGGISHFVVPEGHFFIIGDEDIFRLKYASEIPHDSEAGNLTHTIIIESQMFNAMDESQSGLGEEERTQKEEECGKEELKELGF